MGASSSTSWRRRVAGSGTPRPRPTSTGSTTSTSASRDHAVHVQGVRLVTPPWGGGGGGWATHWEREAALEKPCAGAPYIRTGCGSGWLLEPLAGARFSHAVASATRAESRSADQHEK